MKYIGNLLLGDNLLSKEQLLECMIEKMESIPHLSRVVFDKKLLDVEQQLEVFKFLSENSTNYIGACKSLNLWSKNFENEILKEIEEKHKTLSEIIIAKEYLSWEQLIDVFDRFFNEDDSSLLTEKKSIPANEFAEQSKTKFVALYENFFNQEKFDQILSMLESANLDGVKTNAEFATKFEEIKSLLFEVYSSAEFIEATYSIKLLGAIIDYTNRIIEKCEGEEDISQFVKDSNDEIKKGLTLSWDLRKNLVSSGSEFSNNGPKQESIDTCIDELLNQGTNK